MFPQLTVPSTPNPGTAYMGQPRQAAKPPKDQDFDGILTQAKKEFGEAVDGWEDIRKNAQEELRFWWGDQWPPDDENARQQMKRPCLKFNLTRQFTNQVTNEQKQSRPAVQINPVGSGADVETAEVIEGICRHIEQLSSAEQAYDEAFEAAVIHGFGFWRLRTEYIDIDSNDQEILIESIEDPFTVYLDPASKKKDRSDARYAYIVKDLTRDQFEQEYPDASPVGLSQFTSAGDAQQGWWSTGTVRVVERYWVEEVKERAVWLQSGRWKAMDDLVEGRDRIYLNEKQMPVVKKRTRKQIRWCKMTAAEVLESADIPGSIIPIIPVWGTRKYVDGMLRIKGMVRDLMDAQRAYNFDRTALVETNNLVPKAQWLGTPEQVEEYESMYQQANIRNLSVLYYNAVRDGQGQPLPPPQRIMAAPQIAHLVTAVQLDSADMQAIAGLYRPSLGVEQERGQSGKAILAVQKQGQTANFNYGDSLKNAIELTGKIMIEWIPVYYDAPRSQRIVNPDNTHKIVMLNQPITKPDGSYELNDHGQPRIYDVTVGRYDVTVNVGPSFVSRRQEFVESVLSLVQAAPQIAPFIMDLVVRNMDWPGANEIADRLKKMLPPQLQDDPQNGPPMPPQAQAQIQALQQQMQLTAQELQKAQQVIQTKQIEANNKLAVAALDAKVKLQLEDLKSKVALAVQAMKDGQAGWETLVAHDYQATEHQLSLIDAQADRDHAVELQRQQQEAQAAQAQVQQQAAQASQKPNPAPSAPQ